MSEPLIESNIKGLRWRDLFAIIGCTASIMIAVLSIKSDVKEIKSAIVADARVYELKFMTIETTLKALQAQIDVIRSDVYINRKNIEINK